MIAFRLIAVASLVALVAMPLRAQQSDGETITIATPNTSLTFSAGYLAEDLGLWTKRGLKVKKIVISGIGALNAVISGSVDFAEASGSALTRAAAHGQRMLAIAITIDRPFIEIVLRKDLADAAGFDPAQTLAQRGLVLRGRTIAIESINASVHAYLRLVGARSGYSPDDIRIAAMQPNAALAAFATQQIDGFAQSLPWTLIPVQAGSARLIASGPNGDPTDLAPFAHNLVITRPETCERRKAICAAVGGGYAEAIGEIQEHPAEALALMQKRFATLDPKLLAIAFAAMRKVSPSPPVVTKAALENAEIFSIDAELLKPEEKLSSYDGLYTDQFVK